jgi:hypothetical protein
MAAAKGEKGDSGTDSRFVIAGKAAAPAEPGEGLLNDPPPGLHGKALLSWRAADERDGNRRGLDHTGSGIGTVGKAADQERPWTARHGQESRTASAIV